MAHNGTLQQGLPTNADKSCANQTQNFEFLAWRWKSFLFFYFIFYFFNVKFVKETHIPPPENTLPLPKHQHHHQTDKDVEELFYFWIMHSATTLQCIDTKLVFKKVRHIVSLQNTRNKGGKVITKDCIQKEMC